jgi:peptidoglycan/LPS O-acetylase OafA/YrhL
MRCEKLNALTSLRFFAASLIVIHHSQGLFGIPNDINRYFPTYQAVSFFFVLSGLILTYVYKSFESGAEIKRFCVARIARIWPLHATTLMIVIVLFHREDLFALVDSDKTFKFYSTFAANFLMLQAWIPVKEYFWSFNAVSWSISTEFAFYLLFPFLLFRLRENWKIKFLFILLLSVSFVAFCTFMKLPDGKGAEIGMLGLLNINPMVRMLEFTIGMCTAVFYDKLKKT